MLNNPNAGCCGVAVCPAVLSIKILVISNFLSNSISTYGIQESCGSTSVGPVAARSATIAEEGEISVRTDPGAAAK